MSGMRIAISGASGLIGSRLRGAFESEGDEVLRLVRHHSDDAGEVFWDPATGEIEGERLEGLDVVIHLAGKPLDEQRWNDEVKRAVWASRIDGTALLCTTLATLQRPPRVLISASATDYYAASAAPIGESDGRPGTGFVSEMCRAWEQATEPARAAGIRVVTIRIPSVLGGSGHSIDGALQPLCRRGLGPVFGSGRQLVCFISCDDLVRAVQHIIADDRLEGPVNVIAPAPVTFKTLVRTLSGILGRRTYVRVPGVVLRLIMGEVAGEFLEGDANLRPERLEASGFRHLYPDVEAALRHELRLSPTEATAELTLRPPSCPSPSRRTTRSAPER